MPTSALNIGEYRPTLIFKSIFPISHLNFSLAKLGMYLGISEQKMLLMSLSCCSYYSQQNQKGLFMIPQQFRVATVSVSFLTSSEGSLASPQLMQPIVLPFLIIKIGGLHQIYIWYSEKLIIFYNLFDTLSQKDNQLSRKSPYVHLKFIIFFLKYTQLAVSFFQILISVQKFIIKCGIIIVKMRKYLKSKEQPDANSNIFKQAKRRFHYEPSHKENKYFLHSKNKHQSTSANRQFKDDFSSVKELKNQTHQINESSWIVKLVNVMHENSEEDVKAQQTSQQSNNFLSLRPIESKEIHEPPKETNKCLQPIIKEQSKEVTPVATKKNSVNTEMMIKKRSKSQKSESCDTVSRKNKNHQRVDTIKRNRNEVDLKRNRSQSLINGSDQKQQNDNNHMKSMKNISNSKANTQKVKKEHNSIASDQYFHSSKQLCGNLGIQSKLSSQINKLPEVKDMNGSVAKQKIPKQNLQSSICYQELKDNILEDGIPDDLFALSTNQKSAGLKTQVHQTTQKRSYIGSIKKNKPFDSSQRKNIITSSKPVQIPQQKHPKKEDVIIFQRKQQDIVTAREQQHLIDKYLNNDYSFKKQSNMFRYEYPTSDFDRSLSHLNKPAITLERPLNSGKLQMRHQSYMSKRQEKNHPIFQKYEQKPISKREPVKKFNYITDNGEKQTTENSMSVEVLTLRCNQDQTKIIETSVYTRPLRNDNNQPYTYVKPSHHFRSHNEEDLKRIHQKYNYQVNKQNQSKIETRKNSVNISVIPTKRENLSQIRPNIINRNPYLQQSTYKGDDFVSNEIKISSTDYYDCPTFKMESNPPPINRQRGQSNFNIDNLNSISRRDFTNSEIFSQAQSDHMITRLNSKLNSYINQYQLQKQQEQPQSCREIEPTHRRINLNFNELKKHHDIFKR